MAVADLVLRGELHAAAGEARVPARLRRAVRRGLAREPHLHFEVRAVRKEGGYGPPFDPRRFLPPLSVS